MWSQEIVAFFSILAFFLQSVFDKYVLPLKSTSLKRQISSQALRLLVLLTLGEKKSRVYAIVDLWDTPFHQRFLFSFFLYLEHSWHLTWIGLIFCCNLTLFKGPEINILLRNMPHKQLIFYLLIFNLPNRYFCCKGHTEEVTGCPSKIRNNGKKCICETAPKVLTDTIFIFPFFLFALNSSDPFVLIFLLPCPSSVVSTASFKTSYWAKGNVKAMVIL